MNRNTLHWDYIQQVYGLAWIHNLSIYTVEVDFTLLLDDASLTTDL